MNLGLSIVDECGELIATVMKVGNGRQVMRNWVVYWGLRHGGRETHLFAHRVDALAWVRQQFPQARIVK